MEDQFREVERGGERPTIVYYTCSPYGGVLCGVSLVVIGAALLFSELEVFDWRPAIIWGLALAGLGIFTIAWGVLRRDV